MNLLKYIFSILQNLIVPETQNFPALLLRPCGTCSVRGQQFAVLTTIHLNSQFQLNTSKIQNKFTNRMLAPEFQATYLSTA